MSAVRPSAYSDVELPVDAQRRSGCDGPPLAVRDPASGEVIGHVACACLADWEGAVLTAQHVLTASRAMPALARLKTMRGAAASPRQRIEPIETWLTMEQVRWPTRGASQPCAA